MHTAIEVDLLSTAYGQVKALDGLSLRASTVLGLPGPNGSSKTTAVSILSTALVPGSGTATVRGLDVVRQASAAREVIGFAGQFAAAPRRGRPADGAFRPPSPLSALPHGNRSPST